MPEELVRVQHGEPIKEADIKTCFFFILYQRPIGVIAELLTDE